LKETAKEKQSRYELLLKQMESLIVEDIPASGNISNLLAQMKGSLNLFWVGLYLRQGDTLGLGSFQGLPACTRIHWGKGVCGTAAAKGETVIVEDVTQFPGYIACHAEARSEIVIPGFDAKGEVSFVLDVDSEELAAFDETDKRYLEQAARLFEKFVN
jgi:GAF domain-containing protein